MLFLLVILMLQPLSGQLGPLGKGGGRRIPKPLLWLRADSIIGLDDGDPVGLWPDRSGHGLDAAQATAGLRPLYKAAFVNGKSVVRFDGNTKALVCPDSPLLEPTDTVTVFAVAAVSAFDPVAGSIFSKGASPEGISAWGLYFFDGEPPGVVAYPLVEVFTAISLERFYIWTVTYRPVETGIQVMIRKDGAEVISQILEAAVLSAAGDNFTLGYISTPFYSFLGDIAELRVYGAFSDERYVHKFEHILGAYYGITIS